jgi:hypothetical protein
MGLHLPPGSSLDGVPVAHIKRAAARTYTHRDDAPAFAALEKRGWAWRNAHRQVVTSEQGTALGRAHLRPRVPLAAAEAVYTTFQDGIDRLAQDGLITAEVWVFGSFLRRAPFVGDLDIAVRLSPVGGHDAFMESCAARYGDQAWHQERMRDRGRWMLSVTAHRTVFGRRRHPLLDGVAFDLGQLVCGMPTRCVYTHDGGWHNGPVLDHHPCADGPASPRQPVVVAIDQGVFSTVNPDS